MLSQLINQLLVLGLVPGTNLQITFTEILIAVEAVLLTYLFRSRLPLQKLAYYKARIIVYLSIGRGTQLKLPA